MTYKVSLDSSIIISHLSGDIHKADVLDAIERLLLLKAELFHPDGRIIGLTSEGAHNRYRQECKDLWDDTRRPHKSRQLQSSYEG